MRVSICAIAKNEPDLEDWIKFHLMIEFDHIYIYDNESSIPISSYLNKYSKYCTIKMVNGKDKQKYCYNLCCDELKSSKKDEWIMFLDCDE